MRKLIMIAMLVAGAIGANAQRGYDKYESRGRFETNYDKIDNYQREARRQIANGIESGRLTSNEAKRLLREVERIEEKEKRFKRDGRLDTRERNELSKDLAVLNSWIAREKADRDRITYDEYSKGYASGRYNDRYGRGY